MNLIQNKSMHNIKELLLNFKKPLILKNTKQKQKNI